MKTFQSFLSNHPSILLRAFILASLFLTILSPVSPVWADTPVFDAVDWGSMPQMQVGQSWSYDFNANSTDGGIVYAVSSGSIPGLSINSSTGVYSGVPGNIGSYVITISATDSQNHGGSISHTFDVVSTTTLTIQELSTSYPFGGYVTNYPVWVVVQLETASGSTLPGGETVQISSNNGGPSCNAMIDHTGIGDCGLTFTTNGDYQITASYAGSQYYLSSSDTENIHINSPAPQAQFVAGRYHSCYLNSTGNAACWGNIASFTQQDSEGTILSSIEDTNLVQISGGGYHSCGIKLDGSIQCWGDSAEIISGVPNSENGNPIHYIQINSGDDHVCGIDSRYHLHCWGEEVPAELAAYPSGQFVNLDAGVVHDCAIQKDTNQLTCWGDNSQGQITVPANLGSVKQVSVGNTHTCVIKADDSVDCWGTAFPDPNAALDFKKIDSGSNFSCGLTTANVLNCWGTNTMINDTPSGTYSALTSGLQHACAIDNDVNGPYLSCWGNNDQTQAPALSLSPDTLPLYLPLGSTWEQIFSAAGGTEPYTLSTTGNLPSGISLNAMTLSGTLSTAGTYTFQTTVEESFPAASPNPFELKPVTHDFTIQVQDPSTSIVINNATNNADVGSPVIVQVTVSKSATPDFSGYVTINGQEPNTTCRAAVDSSGNAQCSIYFNTAGDKTILAAYDGDDFYQATTVSAQTMVTINPIVIQPDVTAGGHFGCSLNNSGQVTCWGENDSGQSTPPSFVFKEISAGTSHVCGITAQSLVSCWGWNGYNITHSTSGFGIVEISSGETHACARNFLGNVNCWGDTSNNLTNVPATIYSQIDAGAFHTCGIRSSDQLVLCWGQNDHAQLDLGVYASSAFDKISAGEKGTCGILNDGTLVCWGEITTPPSGTYQQISVGTNHACAINSAGELVCWGDNTDGKTTPPAGTYTTVQSGSDHSCALRSDGYLKCWGYNSLGQAPRLTILPDTVPTLSVEADWNNTFSANGGRDSNYSFSVVNGSLPLGLTLDSNTGAVSGTLTTGDDYQYTLRVFEETLSPALIAEKTYTQRVKANVDFGPVSITPANPVVGQATTLHFSVEEAADSAFGSNPTGNITVSINGLETCTLNLNNGEASCVVFFETPGEKTILVSYSGDERFLTGDTSGAETTITVFPFSQTIQLRSGYNQTYIHRPDGTLTCIGDGCALNVFNEIYTVFGSGDSLSCGLQTDGQVLCFDGQDETLYSGPFQSLAVGKDHVCAINLNGVLTCWGNNDSGQTIAPAGIFTAIFAGDKASCAVSEDDQLQCWGENAVVTPPSAQFSQVSIGSGFACGLTADESIQCWGTEGSQTQAPAGNNFVQISGGSQHTCAINAEGTVQCWGEINGENVPSPYGTFFEINGADDHSCALRAENQITCWGEDDAGEAPQILVVNLEDVETPALTYWEHFFEPSNGQSPYTGSVSYGNLPSGTNFQFSPAGLVLYGTPSTPGRFDFALRWVDSNDPQLVLEELHRITVTGMDLSVTINATHPNTALFNNPFSFFYTVNNQSDLDVTDSLLTIILPNDMEDFSVSGFSGCTQEELILSCLIPLVTAHDSLTIKVSGLVTAAVNEEITTSAVVESTQENWPEINSSDNSAQMSVNVLTQSLVLQEDFSETPSSHWSDGTQISAPSGEIYLGDFDNSQNLRLLLTDLAPHQEIRISFDLYIIGDWQGNGTAANPLPAIYQFGPTGETPLIKTTFCNQDCFQAYPDNYPGGLNNPQTGAETVDSLGFPGEADAVYHFTYQVEHTESSLDLSWLSENLHDGVRFGIDNVTIELDSGWKFIYLPLITR